MCDAEVLKMSGTVCESLVVLFIVSLSHWKDVRLGNVRLGMYLCWFNGLILYLC